MVSNNLNFEYKMLNVNTTILRLRQKWSYKRMNDIFLAYFLFSIS